VAGSGTSPTTQDLSLMPNSLASGGMQYKFKLTATDSSGVEGSATMLVTTGHPPACDSGCLTVSPASGASLSTTFTLTAPVGSGTVPGWYDYDSEGTFTYDFGYVLDGESYLLTAAPQTANFIQTSALPPGQLTFFVTVHDPAHGSVGPVSLGVDALLVGAAQATTVTAATDTSTAALNSALDYSSSTPPDEAFRIMSSVTANLDTTASDASTVITKLATNLQATLDGAGGAMTEMAAGSLELMSANPTALTSSSTDQLANCLDTALSKATGPMPANTASQLIEVAANLGQAHRALDSRRAPSWAEEQSQRLRTIAFQAADGLTAHSPGINLQISHIEGTISMQLQKAESTGLADNSFGSVEYGATIQMSAEFAASKRDERRDALEVYTLHVTTIDVANSMNTNTPTKYTLTSNLVVMDMFTDIGLQTSSSGIVTVTLYNLADNSSPVCLSWDSTALEYKSHAEGGACSTDVTRSYRTIGGAVVCQCTALGDVAVGVGCDASTSCSAHGSCNLDASCKCDESWWGADCSVQRCTDVTTCGPNGFSGECVFNQTATHMQTPAYPKAGCAEVCDPVESAPHWQADMASEDPQLYGDCICQCGWDGPLCDIKVACDVIWPNNSAGKVRSSILAGLFAVMMLLLHITWIEN